MQTGSLPQLQTLLEEIPESVLTLLRIPGLGPKKAAVLYSELGIVTWNSSSRPAKRSRCEALKGFGAKTEEAILKGMHMAEAAGKRIYWSEADKIVTALRSASAVLPGRGTTGIRRQLPAWQRDGRRPRCPGRVV